MSKRIILGVASAAAAGLIAGTPATAQEVTGSVGADVTSAYIFRGGTVNDEVNVQPYIEASVHGVTFGTWANFNTDTEQFDEIDYYVGYDIPMPEDVPLGLSVGYTEYTFPTGTETTVALDGTSTTTALEADRELYASIGLDAILAPSLFVGYGLEGPFLDEGIYLELSAGHDLELSEEVALSLGAALGYEAGDNFAENGFSHLTLSVGSGFGPFSFSLNYVVETDDEVLVVDEDFFFTVGASL